MSDTASVSKIREQTIYIASDGLEFKSRAAADKYEAHIASLALTSESLVRSVDSLAITSESQHQAAAAFLVEEINPGIKFVEALLGDTKKSAHTSHKQISAKETVLLKPYEDAKAKVNRLILNWHAEVRRLAEVEQTRLEQDIRDREQQLALDRAAELSLSDDPADQSEAQDILSDVTGRQDGTLPLIPVSGLPPISYAPPKAPGVAPRTLRRFDLLDAGLLRPEFTLPDLKKIQALVNVIGVQAEDMVTRDVADVIGLDGKARRAKAIRCREEDGLASGSLKGA